MTTENHKNELITAAYIAGRDAIIKHLGKTATSDEILDVIQLLAHSALCANGTLGPEISRHNGEVFSARLQSLIEESQKNIPDNGYCGRLM